MWYDVIMQPNRYTHPLRFEGDKQLYVLDVVQSVRNLLTLHVDIDHDVIVAVRANLTLDRPRMKNNRCKQSLLMLDVIDSYLASLISAGEP